MPGTSTVLNLTRDNTAQVGWHLRDAGRYNTEYANQLEEPAGTEPDKMLAAIPSPFARLHVFDVAFGLLSNPARRIEGTTVFHRVASQCLDALELLFHWKTLIASGFPLSIVRWDAEGELQAMQRSQTAREAHHLLAEAIELYLQQDKAIGAVQNEFWMLVADAGKPSVLAISSPFTILAPSPGAAAEAARLHLKVPGEGRLFFAETKSLPERSPAFRAYVEHFFARTATGVNPLHVNCEHLHAYVARTQQVEFSRREVADYAKASYDDVVEGGSPITLFGIVMPTAKASPVPPNILASRRRIRSDRGVTPLPILLVDSYDSLGVYTASFKAPTGVLPPLGERLLPDFKCPYPFVVESDFFDDTIIRLPYPLNTDAFVLPRDASKLEAAFLPPIKPAYYEFFSEREISSRLKFEPEKGDGVRCTLEIPLQETSVQLTKVYYPKPHLATAGRIVDANFSLAAFPSPMWEGPKLAGSKSEQTVALVEVRPQGEKWRSRLRFHRLTASGLNPAPEASLSTVERTGKDDIGFSSRFYTLTDWQPDLIEVLVDAGQGAEVRSFLTPVRPTVSAGKRQFILAVDFGTTNSHVTLAEKTLGSGNPTMLDLRVRGKDTGQTGVATLHNPATTGRLVVETVEFALRHEFVPNDISDDQQTLMPTRTAVAERPQGHAETLFADGNIAFFMYRSELRTPQQERIQTHLKWAKKSDKEIVKRIRLFIREILMLARAQILLNGGDPSTTDLLWFWPLSFTEFLRSTLDLVWQEEAKRVLGTSSVRSLTESAAPYFYQEATGTLVSTAPVLNVDIGGGSTDVVFFESRVPKFGTSFNFAGNGLWGAGFSRANGRAQWNGVARMAERLIQAVGARLDTKKKVALDKITGGFLTNSELSTSEEMVNLGFKTDDFIGFIEELRRDTTVKLMVLLHYSAIVFHCAQMMRELKLAKPKLISLSGNGCKALAILDVTGEKRFLAAHTSRIFSLVYEHWDEIAKASIGKEPLRSVESLRPLVKTAANGGPMSVLMAEKMKEATCEGGIFWLTLSSGEPRDPQAYVLLNGAGTLHERDDVPRYNEIQPSDLDRAATEFRRFLAIFGALAPGFDKFGLSESAALDVMPELWDSVEDGVLTGLERRKLNAEGPLERAVETMFFYPLVHKLWQLSQHVK